MFPTRVNKYQGLRSDPEDQRKKVIVWSCSIFLLVALATLSFAAVRQQGAKAKALPSHIHHATVSRGLAAAGSLSPRELFHLSVQQVISYARSTHGLSNDLTLSDEKRQSRTWSAMDDCTELLDDSIMQLSDVAKPRKGATADDIHTWLSAALTHQETCIDGLENVKSPAAKAMVERARNLTQLTSKSLALYTTMVGRSKSGGGRKLLSDGFPEWVSAADRKLLETPVNELRPHAVVANDGSGTHKSISEALLSVSLAAGEGGGGGRTVIHLKAGTYSETVNIPSKQKNVMLVGDGKGITVITGHKSNGGGASTFGSATFGVSGEGFIAKDISFVNSAGPGGEQAVALRVGSDRSVIYRCSIQGYQDSLYSLSNRQFYRETDIYGTVDFIFGNSAAVFQACNINAIKGGSDQKNFVTAQGRSDPNQNTGFSFQNSRISGTGVTYLGRPWKKCSRVVIMQSSLSGIQSAGWYPWSGGSSPSAVYLAEYMNSGPSSSTSGRVGWPGYHASISPAEASKFTVAAFISGNQWLPGTGVPFDAGL